MIEIVRSGSQLCLVDQGRQGYRKYGIPEAGPMDSHSYLCANSIIGNPSTAPCLELYESGHQFRFLSNTTIALSGASGDFHLDNQLISINQPVHVRAGSLLKIGKLSLGCRAYLAVAGGFDVKSILGSVMSLPGSEHALLSNGSRIEIKQPYHTLTKSRLKPIVINIEASIFCQPGPEYIMLDTAQRQWLLATDFHISHHSNRMGLRLNTAETSNFHNHTINTSAVTSGTVQLPPNGLPLILMRDAQTTGGYPRVLIISEPSMNQLAQRRTGSVVRFHLA